MEFLKQIMIDSFNGFSLRLIPLFLFQLLVAGLIGHLTQKILNRKFQSQELSKGAIIAVGVSLLVSLVKYSLPFSVVGAALLLFLHGKFKEQSNGQTFALFLFALAGLGCGVGSVVQTALGFMVVFIVIFLTPVKINDD